MKTPDAAKQASYGPPRQFPTLPREEVIGYRVLLVAVALRGGGPEDTQAVVDLLLKILGDCRRDKFTIDSEMSGSKARHSTLQARATSPGSKSLV